MDLHPYVDFKGECEAAFTFYEQTLGGTLGPIFRYAGTPLADQVQADWQDKVMHASITIGNQVLLGVDVAPDRYDAPKGFSLALELADTARAERLFHGLAVNGNVIVPLEATFWAARFGIVIDRFGIRWLVNCPNAVDAPLERPAHDTDRLTSPPNA
jgi:PhnB protein